MDRQFEAFAAAEKIVNAVEGAGVDLSRPDDFFKYTDYLPSSIEFDSGATRLVIWDANCRDYVIKIALDKRYEKYCKHEVEVYAAAVKEGVSNSFAWCVCYSEPVEGTEIYVPGIYVMEYLECNEEAASDTAWKHGYEKYCEERGLDSSNWDASDDYNDWRWEETEETVLDYMEDMMTPEHRKIFEFFLCKWWITDIHEGNVSLQADGSMVIVDYAGWGW